MTVIHDACYLNNQSVLFLANGDTKEATAGFQAALSALKYAVDEQDDTPSEHTEQISVGKVQEPSFRESPFPMIGLSTEQGFIYDKSITIDLPDTQHAIDELTLPFYSAVILFNLAQNFHQAARLGKESFYKRAAMLYGMCRKLLGNLSQPTMATIILYLLALNNQAQVHYEQCEYENSQLCLKEMSMIMSDTKGIKDFLSGRLMEGLVLNIMLLEPPKLAHAA